MDSARTIFQNALLAQAVYGNFDIDSGSTIYLDNRVKDRLRVEGDAGFTNDQATNFAGPQGYSLLSFTADTSSGFEAALFESRSEPGKYTLAIRGTAGLLDIVGADIFGVVAQGQAAAQSVSLYRYYKRLITPRGAAVEYSQAEIEMLTAVTNRKYDGYGVALLRNSRDFQMTAADLAQRLGSDSGLGRLDPNAIIDVTGHSLGGHLAQIFGALYFPDRVGHIYTYNGAGLGGAVYKSAKRYLADRGVDLAAKTTNIVAEEGLTLTAAFGYKFGPVQRLAIEEGVLTDNHSITNSTDSLAIYDLLGLLSPDLSLDTFNQIIRGATNEARNGYEATLDIVRRIFLGLDIQATQPSFRDDLAARDELYKSIDELKSSVVFKSFVGTSGRPYSVASLVGALNLAGLAGDDTDGIAYRYALKQLNPFALVGLDYAQHNQNGELDLYDATTGKGAITSEWLQDRAQFLAWKVQKNLNDIADGVSILRKDNGAQSYLYTDKTLKDSQGQDYSIRVAGSNSLQRTDPIRISFAGDAGDTVQGGNYADHLYGGRGGDTLDGNGGDDYLEGGAGDDTLNGGAGDDILRGGKGDDTLQGGADNDVYLICAGDGRDTIVDHEGRNTVVYVDASGKRVVLGIPAFAVAGATNTWRGYLPGAQPVSFTRNSPLTATLSDGSQIIFDDYQDGDFGIRLEPAATSDAAARIILGDLQAVHFDSLFDDQGREYSWTSRVDYLGNVITDPSAPAPDIPDVLYGSDGDDFIAGLGGNDYLYGGDGADLLQGGAGVDRVYGDDGDDTIEGQGGDSIDDGVNTLYGGAGDDTVFAATRSDIGDAIAQGANAGSSVPGSALYGDAGDDILVGSAGNDFVVGGDGSDILIGGGGADQIWGDASLPQWFFSLPDAATEASSADWIYGGGGDDIIYAGAGDDYVDGGDGDDRVIGESGSDTIFGGAGNDNLSGQFAGINSPDAGDDYIDGGDGNDDIYGSAGDDVLLGGAGDDRIYGGGGDDFIDGGDGNDCIQGSISHGGTGDDLVVGTPDADELYGDDGNDTLVGHGFLWTDFGGPGFIAEILTFGSPIVGGDWLYGGAGDDTYVLTRGGGTSHIVDDSGSNTVELHSYEIVDRPDLGNMNRYAPIARDSIHLELRDGDYSLAYGEVGDRVSLGASLVDAVQSIDLIHITIGVRFDEDVEPENQEAIYYYVYKPEAVPISSLELMQYASTDGDSLIATEGIPNTLEGQAGDDVIVGASREDVLIGGPGDDFLDGGEGGDRYVFNPGDGVDIVSDSGTQGTDTLVFGPGIAVESLSLEIADALLIRIGDAGDVIYVDGFDPDDAAGSGGIERFEFADGTVLSRAQLVSPGFDLPGTDGDDTTFGTNLTDRFYESAGDDSLVGGAGDDVYYFAAGSGHDLIVDFDTALGNFDTVVLGDGIAPENLAVQSSPGVLSLALIGANDRLDIQWQPQDGYAIERVHFADGTIWDGGMLESQAVPAPQAEAGTEAVEEGSAPPADAGSADAGAGMPTSGESAQQENGEAPPAESEMADAGVDAPPADTDVTQASNDSTQPENAGTTTAEAEAPASNETAQIADDAGSPADLGLANSKEEAPTNGDTTQIVDGGTPSTVNGTYDVGAETWVGYDVAQTGNELETREEASAANVVSGPQTDADAAQIGDSQELPADAGSGLVDAEAPTSGDAVEATNSGTSPADTATVGAGADAPIDAGAIAAADSAGPPADDGTFDVAEEMQAGGNIPQIGSGTALGPVAEPADAGTRTTAVSDATQIASGEASLTDSGVADASAVAPTSGGAIEMGNGGTLSADIGTLEVGAVAIAGGESSQSGDNGTPPADTDAADVEAAAQAGEVAVQIGGDAVPSSEVEPSGAVAALSIAGTETPIGIDAGSTADSRESGVSSRIPAGGGTAAGSPKSQPTAPQNGQDTLAAALRMLGVTDFEAALSPTPGAAKPLELGGAQFAGGQTALASNPDSFFAALRPTQPSLQSWLDNWLGPRGRAAVDSQELLPTDAIEDLEPPSGQDFAPLNLPADLPPDQPEAMLTADEIAQSYQDIEFWLDENPGTEPDMAGASAPVRNPFAYFGGDSGYAPTLGYGRNPEMATLGGHELAPLRGISDGYSVLAVV